MKKEIEKEIENLEKEVKKMKLQRRIVDYHQQPLVIYYDPNNNYFKYFVNEIKTPNTSWEENEYR